MITLVQGGCRGRLLLHVKAFLHHNSKQAEDLLADTQYLSYQHQALVDLPDISITGPGQPGFRTNTNVEPRVRNPKQNNKREKQNAAFVQQQSEPSTDTLSKTSGTHRPLAPPQNIFKAWSCERNLMVAVFDSDGFTEYNYGSFEF